MTGAMCDLTRLFARDTTQLGLVSTTSKVLK